MNWIDIILPIISGILVCIPLVIKLVEYVQKSIKEKNWKTLLETIMRLMKMAEVNFNNGIDKKDWVLSSILASADSVDYNIDVDEISKMIDALVDLSNHINKNN